MQQPGKFIQVLVEFSISPQQVTEARQVVKELTNLSIQHEPGAVQYNWYISKDESRLTVLQVYPNSSSYLNHYVNVGPLLQQLFECCRILRWQVFGPVTDTALTVLQSVADSFGARVETYSFIDGFFSLHTD